MVPKRYRRQGGEEGSELSNKRSHLASTGLNCGRNLQESLSCLEPFIRKWVQEEVEVGIDRFLRSSFDQVGCSVSSRSLQLQFHGNLPDTLFTGNRLQSEDGSRLKVVVYNSVTGQIITSGPLSSLKFTVVVLDGDFDREDWTSKDFAGKLVKNREGKRPLVAGDQLTVTLQNGVGYLGDLSFTDNSSWSRSGKFRLGAKAVVGDETSIREAVSNAFRVKDHRGESYQKLYPPSTNDEVWRLEKIAKDGPSHKKLNAFGIFSVGDFLRFYATEQLRLRNILAAVSKKTWETIIRHATTCSLEGYYSHPLNSLTPSVAGYPMLLESPSVGSFTDPNFVFQNCEMATNGVGPSTISSPSDVEQDQHRLFNDFPTFSTDSQPGFCIGGNYMGSNSHISTDYDLPMDDDSYFPSGNGVMFLDPGNQDGIIIPRPKTRWCKVLAVVKWRILVRRNVAARKWKHFYSYM